MLDENMIFFKEEFTTHVFLCEKYVTWFSIRNFYSATSKIFFLLFKLFFKKRAKAIKKIIRFRSKVYWKRLAFGTNGGPGFESPMTWRKMG